MLRDVISELFFAIVGIFLLMTPFSKVTYSGSHESFSIIGSLFLAAIGLLFILGLAVTYTVGFRFDEKFKNVFLLDDKLRSKLSLSLVPANWYVSLRMVRAMMYARNIALPRGTKKNWIQKSWFHGYNFKKNSRWFDIVISYIFFYFLVLLFVAGALLGIYVLITNN